MMSVWQRELTTVIAGVFTLIHPIASTVSVKNLLADNKDLYLVLEGKSSPSLKYLSI